MLSLCRASACSAIAVLFLACANGAELDPGVLPDPILSAGGATSGPDASAGNGGEQNGTGGVDNGAGGAELAGGAPGSGAVPESGGTSSGTGGKATGQGGTLGTGGKSSAGNGGTGVAGNGGSVSASGGATGTGGANTGGGTASCGANQKRCNNACVPAAPANGCNGSSCTACPGPAPDHGFLTCSGQGACDFDCLSAFTRSGSQCVSSTGGGSGGSSGAGGSGGTLMCGNDACRTCNLGNTVACCDKLLGNCTCALSNLKSLLCK